MCTGLCHLSSLSSPPRPFQFQKGKTATRTPRTMGEGRRQNLRKGRGASRWALRARDGGWGGLFPSAYPNCRSHPGTAASGGKGRAGHRGRGLAWLAASGSVSPPRGQVRPSRDPPRPASLACNVSQGWRQWPRSWLCEGGGSLSLLSCPSFCRRSRLPTGRPKASTCRTTTS